MNVWWVSSRPGGAEFSKGWKIQDVIFQGLENLRGGAAGRRHHADP